MGGTMHPDRRTRASSVRLTEIQAGPLFLLLLSCSGCKSAGDIAHPAVAATLLLAEITDRLADETPSRYAFLLYSLHRRVYQPLAVKSYRESWLHLTIGAELMGVGYGKGCLDGQTGAESKPYSILCRNSTAPRVGDMAISELPFAYVMELHVLL